MNMNTRIAAVIVAAGLFGVGAGVAVASQSDDTPTTTAAAPATTATNAPGVPTSRAPNAPRQPSTTDDAPDAARPDGQTDSTVPRGPRQPNTPNADDPAANGQSDPMPGGMPGGTPDGSPGGPMGQSPGAMGEGQQQGPMGQRPPGPGLAAVAELLGTTEDDLHAQLQSGTTLASIAAQRGVSTDSLVEVMVAELEAHVADEVPAGQLTQAEADQRLANAVQHVTAIVNGERPQGPAGMQRPS
jgi:hypothetical protein